MSDDRLALTEDYANVVRGLDKLILQHAGATSMDTLMALQSVHIEQLRRCHAAAAVAKQDARSFPEYLRDLAAAHEAAEVK